MGRKLSALSVVDLLKALRATERGLAGRYSAEAKVFRDEIDRRPIVDLVRALRDAQRRPASPRNLTTEFIREQIARRPRRQKDAAAFAERVGHLIDIGFTTDDFQKAGFDSHSRKVARELGAPSPGGIASKIRVSRVGFNAFKQRTAADTK
jgi:hypothetical protein